MLKILKTKKVENPSPAYRVVSVEPADPDFDGLFMGMIRSAHEERGELDGICFVVKQDPLDKKVFIEFISIPETLSYAQQQFIISSGPIFHRAAQFVSKFVKKAMDEAKEESNDSTDRAGH